MNYSFVTIFGLLLTILAVGGRPTQTQANEYISFNSDGSISVRQRKSSRPSASRRPRRPAMSWNRNAPNPLAVKAKEVDGAVKLVVSISDQRLVVYKGSQVIGTSKVSTGKAGHATPTGVFSVLQKRRRHYSNLYHGAPMPFMQRLTWSGIALHAGRVPGYPASHGCIRLPYSFAPKLFGIDTKGAHVIVTKMRLKEVEVGDIQHAKLFQPTTLESLTGRTAVPVSETPIKPPASYQITTGSIVASEGTADSVSASKSGVAASEAFGDLEMLYDRMQTVSQRSELPLRILITRPGKRSDVLHVQQMLQKAGHDPGEPDGAMGPQTSRAIAAFQRAQGLPETGSVSGDLIERLSSVAGAEQSPNGHILVRLGYRQVFDAPVRIENPDRLLGTHVFKVQSIPTDDEARWTVTTIEPTRFEMTTQNAVGDANQSAPSSPAEVLDRIELPAYARRFISDRLTVGSSLIVADNGHSNETGRYTDFIVKTVR